MNMNKITKLALVAVLAISVSVVATQITKGDISNCSNPQSVLDAHILSAGEFGGGALAIVTNNSDCSFNVGLDAYQTSNNQLFDSLGSGLGPRQTVELHINVPNCQYRLELSTGDIILDSQTVRSNVCGVSIPSPVTCIDGIAQYLHGVIYNIGDSSGRALASVTNSSSSCVFVVTLASYKMNDLTGSNWINTQELVDYKTVSVGPGTTEYSVVTPIDSSCRYQLDLIEGPVLQIPDYGGAGRYFLDIEHGGPNVSCRAQSAPTPTPLVSTPNSVLTPVVSVPVCSSTDYVAQISYPAVNNNIRIFIDDTASSPSAWDKVLDGSNGSTSAPAGFNPRLPGMSSLTLQPGVRYYSFIQNSSGVEGQTINWIVNVCPTSTPTPTPTPTPYPTSTPTPTPTPFVIPVPNPVSVNFNSPCAVNAFNSCNVTNTSTITQTGTGNNAQVNQSGSITGYTGTQQNLYPPVLAATVVTPIPVQNTSLNISKMVRNISTNTSEVKSVNANVNNTVEFVIRVSANNQTATNVRVVDSLPYGLTYIPGSTTVDNSYLNDGITSNGISLGSFYSGRLATIRFRVTVGQGYNYNQYNYGSTTFTNSVSAYADNASTVTDSASVIVGSYVNPQPNQVLTIQKTARNISRGDTVQQTSLSARAGEGIEFTITVNAPYNTNLTNVVVSDLLPAGMNYTVRSTTLNNIVTTDGIVSGGLNIGSLSSGQKAEIKFYATINTGVSVNQQLVNTASARADNVSLLTSNPVYITIGNSAVLAGALKIKTGPTEVAFAIAGFGGLFSSVLYAGRRKLLGLIKLA